MEVRYSYLLCLLVLIALFLQVQSAPQDRFDLYFGNSQQQTNGEVNITPDGGFLISGSHFEGVDQEFLLMSKLTNKGELVWAKRVGRPLDSYGQQAHSTSDGGVIGVLSLAHAIHDNKYMTAIKFDSNLNFEWGAMIGAQGNHDYVRGIAFAQDGGYVLAGHTYNEGIGSDDVLLAKISGSGAQEWIRILGESGSEYTRRIIALQDGGYLVCGYTKSFNTLYDIFLIKIDGQGSVVWQKRLGDDSVPDFCWGLAESSQDNFLYIGGATGFSSSRNAMVAKITQNGDLVWLKLYGGVGQTELRDLILTSDHHILIVGQTKAFGVGLFDFFLSKLDLDGNLVFTHTYGTASGNEQPKSLRELPNGEGYIMGGRIDSGSMDSILLIKLSSEFEYCGNLETRQVTMEEFDVTTDPTYKLLQIAYIYTNPAVVSWIPVIPLIDDVTSLMEVTMADYCLQSSNLELQNLLVVNECGCYNGGVCDSNGDCACSQGYSSPHCKYTIQEFAAYSAQLESYIENIALEIESIAEKQALTQLEVYTSNTELLTQKAVIDTVLTVKRILSYSSTSLQLYNLALGSLSHVSAAISTFSTFSAFPFLSQAVDQLVLHSLQDLDQLLVLQSDEIIISNHALTNSSSDDYAA